MRLTTIGGKNNNDQLANHNLWSKKIYAIERSLFICQWHYWSLYRGKGFHFLFNITIGQPVWRHRAEEVFPMTTSNISHYTITEVEICIDSKYSNKSCWMSNFYQICINDFIIASTQVNHNTPCRYIFLISTFLACIGSNRLCRGT